MKKLTIFIVLFALASTAFANEEPDTTKPVTKQEDFLAQYQDIEAIQEKKALDLQIRNIGRDRSQDSLAMLIPECLKLKEKYAETTFVTAGEFAQSAAQLYWRIGEYENALEQYHWIADRYGDVLDTVPDFDTDMIRYNYHMARSILYLEALLQIGSLNFKLKEYAKAKEAFQLSLQKCERSQWSICGVTGVLLNAREAKVVNSIAQYGEGSRELPNTPGVYRLGGYPELICPLMIYLIETLYEGKE